MLQLTKRLAVTAAVLTMAVGLAACGSDSDKDDGGSANATTTTAAADTTTTPTLPPETTTTAPPSPYKATATPTENLKPTDKLSVSVSDFKAGLTLGINLCASKDGAIADAPDCALDKISTITVGADGTGTADFQLGDWVFGQVGTAAHDCHDATTRCFLSVGELSADPKAQRADDVDLKFAP